MPLVVPVLRLAYVFLNVFDTFKILRLPPPSARNGGQPSARAMSQRKRAMKGTMTVWLVWTCFTLYERWAEAFIWLFVPFYSEIKALVIIFFILTRAKGAEPIYLHLLRPLIKPYTPVLDALFEGLHSVGDLLILIALIPVQHAQDFYRRWTSSLDPPAPDVNSWHADAPRAPGRPSAHRAYVSESNGDPRPVTQRDVSTGSVRQTRSSVATSGSSTPAHQIWLPPPSAYAEESSLNPHSGLPTPPVDLQQQAAAASQESVDDWRQYPPFPSAYPPTPLPASSSLPSSQHSIIAPRPVRPSNPQFTGIEEESDGEDDTNSTVQQDFRRSLQLPREPRNPGSDGGLSDEIHMNGVLHTQQPEQQQRSQSIVGKALDDHLSAFHMSVDEDAGSDMDYEDEDDFDVTLRTPHPRRLFPPEGMLSDDEMTTPPPTSIAFTVSLDSQVSRSTALSTTDNGSSLRTRTNSISSTAISSVPDSLPVAGQKRRLPRYAEDGMKFNVRLSPRKARGASRITSSRVSVRPTAIARQRAKVVATATASQTKGAIGEDDTPAEAPTVDAKRQKTAGGRVARPKAQRASNELTLRGVPPRQSLKPTTRPAANRQTSRFTVTTRSKERSQLTKKPSAISTTSATRRQAASGLTSQA
ncbi:hypothetical protein C8Q79DRAFT_1006698 [Trametes meyenii]|nr:hypothetical protein C8Q79DRAFT_1006698 [Trametes meyenii]